LVFSHRLTTFGKLSIMIALLAGVFLASLLVGMRLAVRINEVPNAPVVGMKVETARLKLMQSELQLAVVGRRYDAAVPEGDIIVQSPGADIPIRRGGTVRVVVSLGRRTRPVPEVEGVTLRAARLLLQQAGYRLGRVAVLPSPDGDGKVAGQWPPPGDVKALTDAVDVLVVEKSPELFVMPSVLGGNLNRVLQTLNGLEFSTRVYYRNVSGRERGTIVRQYPGPGQPVKAGQVINLEVAR